MRSDDCGQAGKPLRRCAFLVLAAASASDRAGHQRRHRLSDRLRPQGRRGLGHAGRCRLGRSVAAARGPDARDPGVRHLAGRLSPEYHRTLLAARHGVRLGGRSGRRHRSQIRRPRDQLRPLLRQPRQRHAHPGRREPRHRGRARDRREPLPPAGLRAVLHLPRPRRLLLRRGAPRLGPDQLRGHRARAAGRGRHDRLPEAAAPGRHGGRQHPDPRCPVRQRLDQHRPRHLRAAGGRDGHRARGQDLSRGRRGFRGRDALRLDLRRRARGRAAALHEQRRQPGGGDQLGRLRRHRMASAPGRSGGSRSRGPEPRAPDSAGERCPSKRWKCGARLR